MTNITQEGRSSQDQAMANASAPILTFGQKAVGITFNPGGNPEVDRCKQMFANCIDQIHALRSKADATQEQKRLASIAITELQGAQMWAVKALTWKD